MIFSQIHNLDVESGNKEKLMLCGHQALGVGDHLLKAKKKQIKAVWW